MMNTEINWDIFIKTTSVILIAIAAILIFDGQILGEETVEIGSFLGFIGILLVITRIPRK